MKDCENELRQRTTKKLKEDIYSAQRLYYLCQKYDKKIPEGVRNFCKNNLNNYIKIAKNMELQLTAEELYDRLLGK